MEISGDGWFSKSSASVANEIYSKTSAYFSARNRSCAARIAEYFG